jgi:predicted phage terminase large subunit-like protein
MALMLVKDLTPLEEFDAEEARLDFKKFVPLAWHIIEPGRPYIAGWHLDAICEHLEAVSRGEITRLLVNMPPRHGKSSLINVLWSGWLLLNNPAIRLLCGSYALNLATRDNLKTRRLIKSHWFQVRYGDRFSLAKDQDAKMKFETDQLGYRMAVSVGSSATGEGGDVLIGDDFHNIDEKESVAKREAAIDWFDNTWSTRLNDQRTGAMVVVGHRIHMNDVSGHILETAGDEWTHLNLPAEYDPGSPCRTYLPSGKELWVDRRTEEGQLLWEEKFPKPVIERAKKRHGVLGYSALYGQRPIPPGGYVFNRAYERLFEIGPQGDVYLLITPSGPKAVRIADCYELSTSDVAAKDSEANDYTVFAHWAITPDFDTLLLDVQRGHWTIPKQKEHAKQFYQTHYSQRYRAFYFESIGYQSAICQDLLITGMPCLEFIPHGDKVMRAGAASIWQEAGKVYWRKNAVWMEDWSTEIYNFPKDKHDDQVDNQSMVCMIVRTPEIGALEAETARQITRFYGY